MKYHLKSKKPEASSESTRTSKIGLFEKRVNCFQPLIMFAKSPILDVRLSSEYASENTKKIWLTSSRSHSRIFLNSRLVKTSSFFRFAMIVEVYPYSFTSHGWWKWTLDEAPQQTWIAEVSYKTGGKSQNGRFISTWVPLYMNLWYIAKLSIFSATIKL